MILHLSRQYGLPTYKDRRSRVDINWADIRSRSRDDHNVGHPGPGWTAQAAQKVFELMSRRSPSPPPLKSEKTNPYFSSHNPKVNTERPSVNPLPEGFPRPGGLTPDELREASEAYLVGKAPLIECDTPAKFLDLIDLRHSIEKNIGDFVFESGRISL